MGLVWSLMLYLIPHCVSWAPIDSFSIHDICFLGEYIAQYQNL